MVNLIELNIELSNQLFNIGEKCRDPSLTEEEREYYGELYKTIYDVQTGVIKEIREKAMGSLGKFFEEMETEKHLKIMKMAFDPEMQKFQEKFYLAHLRS